MGSRCGAHRRRTVGRWRRLQRLAKPDADDLTPDAYLIAQEWLDLAGPALEAERDIRRRANYILLSHIDARLRTTPIDLDEVEAAMSVLPPAAPLDERVSACIIGVPSE